MTADDKSGPNIEQRGIYGLKVSCQEVRCQANALTLLKSSSPWFLDKISFSPFSTPIPPGYSALSLYASPFFMQVPPWAPNVFMGERSGCLDDKYWYLESILVT